MGGYLNPHLARSKVSWIYLTSLQGEEDEVSSTLDEDDCENLHRKFMRRNVPLYLPKIVIPKHESQG